MSREKGHHFTNDYGCAGSGMVYHERLEMLFRDPITILSYIGVLFAISPKLTIFILILLPLSGLSSAR